MCQGDISLPPLIPELPLSLMATSGKGLREGREGEGELQVRAGDEGGRGSEGLVGGKGVKIRQAPVSGGLFHSVCSNFQKQFYI